MEKKVELATTKRDAGAELTRSALLSESLESLSSNVMHAARAGARATAYSALQTPILGITEIVDRATGMNLMPKVQFMDKLAEAKTPLEKGAQVTGSIIGTIAPLLVTHKFVHAAGNTLLNAESAVVSGRIPLRRIAGEAAVTGAIFDGILQPAHDKSQVLLDRITNGVTGAATFATMSTYASLFQATKLSTRFDRFGLKQVWAFAQSDIGSAALSGLPGGFVNANVNTYLREGRLATISENLTAMGSFSALGGLIGGTLKLAGYSRPAGDFAAKTREAKLRAPGLEQAAEQRTPKHTAKDAPPETAPPPKNSPEVKLEATNEQILSRIKQGEAIYYLPEGVTNPSLLVGQPGTLRYDSAGRIFIQTPTKMIETGAKLEALGYVANYGRGKPSPFLSLPEGIDPKTINTYDGSRVPLPNDHQRFALDNDPTRLDVDKAKDAVRYSIGNISPADVDKVIDRAIAEMIEHGWLNPDLTFRTPKQ